MGMVIGALLRRAINGAQIGGAGAHSTDTLDEDIGEAEPPPGRQAVCACVYCVEGARSSPGRDVETQLG